MAMVLRSPTEREDPMSAEKRQLANADYTVGWICAITVEYVAARAMLDEEHESPEYTAQHDDNSYTLGRINKHNVVIASLPHGECGKVSAASVARDMLHSFPNVRIGLTVGIAGGAPSLKHDIRLGDIVVSTARNDQGGVVVYDFGKTIQNQEFCHTGFLAPPPKVLRSAVGAVKARYESDGHRIQETIKVAIQKKPKLERRFSRPDSSSDRLYCSSTIHPYGTEGSCETRCGTKAPALILRSQRDEDTDDPVIHYGLIASADSVIRDANLRDKLAVKKDVLCFETEAAGLMNHFPCLVIRGISNYADTHKNDDWQGYAAMAAAAYAKDVLSQIPQKEVEAKRRLPSGLAEVKEDLDVSLPSTSLDIQQQEEFEKRPALSSNSNLALFPRPVHQFHQGAGTVL